MVDLFSISSPCIFTALTLPCQFLIPTQLEQSEDGVRKKSIIFCLNGTFIRQFSAPWAWQQFRTDPFSLDLSEILQSFFIGSLCLQSLSLGSYCEWWLALTSATPGDPGLPLIFYCWDLSLLFLHSLHGTPRLDPSRLQAGCYSPAWPTSGPRETPTKPLY